MIRPDFRNSFIDLPDCFYTRQQGEGFARPYLIHFNPEAASLIDLPVDAAHDPDFADFFSGTKPLLGSDPVAMVYAGHQFGTYVPRLGDGRALLLGQVRNRQNESWDIQLKGSGKTPYSRFGDGRAVLRSCIREYLCGEAMQALGIPTSRALCIVGTSEQVMRESLEPGAVMTRLARSHIRFGHFEYFHYTENFDAVHELADHTIAHYFPDIADNADKYRDWLQSVIQSTARLMADWQAVGFAHGVMNTDNMSVLGLTIDYGPFGFMENYNPSFICNHSDPGGRYAFDQQPTIGLWNLYAFAYAILSLVPLDISKPLLEGYRSAYSKHMQKRARAKLGLKTERDEDEALWLDLLALLQSQSVDYTLFFRALSHYPDKERLHSLFPDQSIFQSWEARYTARLQAENSQDSERQIFMLRVNPKFVLRNWVAEQAIRRAEDNGDYSEITRVLHVMQSPFDEHPEHDDLSQTAPEWAGALCVSCSS